MAFLALGVFGKVVPMLCGSNSNFPTTFAEIKFFMGRNRIIPWLGLQVLSPYCCRLKAIKEPISKNLVPSVVFTCYSVPLIDIIIIFSIPKVRSGPTCQRRQDGKAITMLYGPVFT